MVAKRKLGHVLKSLFVLNLDNGMDEEATFAFHSMCERS